jgi:hypothetical protein
MNPMPRIVFISLFLFTLLYLEVGHPSSLPYSASFLLQVQNKKPPPSAAESPADSQSKEPVPQALTSPTVSLKLAFMAEPGLFPYDIEFHTQENTIELTGVVSVEEEKSLATTLTDHLMKGKKILNHIEVSPALIAQLQTTADRRLTELIKQRFATSQTLRDANFEVMTIRGVVSLKGQTRFQVIALEAAQAAREVPGVIAVNTRNIRLEGEND